MTIIYYSDNVEVIDSYKVDNIVEISSAIEDILENDLCSIQVKERTKVSLYREWKAYKLKRQNNDTEINR